MLEKGKTHKNLQNNFKKQWIHRVFSDSLKGTCMKVDPSKVAHRKPTTTKEEWNKVIWTTAIETFFHFDRDTEELARNLCKEHIIEEAPHESPFCACCLFIQKPNVMGLVLVTDYCAMIELINRPEWPFRSTDCIL